MADQPILPPYAVTILDGSSANPSSMTQRYTGTLAANSSALFYDGRSLQLSIAVDGSQNVTLSYSGTMPSSTWYYLIKVTGNPSVSGVVAAIGNATTQWASQIDLYTVDGQSSPVVALRFGSPDWLPNPAESPATNNNVYVGVLAGHTGV